MASDNEDYCLPYLSAYMYIVFWEIFVLCDFRVKIFSWFETVISFMGIIVRC